MTTFHLVAPFTATVLFYYQSKLLSLAPTLCEGIIRNVENNRNWGTNCIQDIGSDGGWDVPSSEVATGGSWDFLDKKCQNDSSGCCGSKHLDHKHGSSGKSILLQERQFTAHEALDQDPAKGLYMLLPMQMMFKFNAYFSSLLT